MSIVVVLDWYTKAIVGHYVGMPYRSQHWLAALDIAVNRQFPDGVRGQVLSLMRDKGCQPTSTSACKPVAPGSAGVYESRQSEGNVDTEASCAPSKRSVWLKEWRCPFELIHALELE
jgi:hypothetical protein